MNYGVLPLTFANEDDYDAVNADDTLEITNVNGLLQDGETHIPVRDATLDRTIDTVLEVSARQREILLAGGLLRYVGQHRSDE